MAENAICNRLRSIILDSQNALQPVRTRIHNSRNEVQNASREIQNLESELQSARISSRITGTAGRLFGGVGGAVVNGLGATESAIRISRLESDIRVENYNLERAKNRLEDLEKEIGEHQSVITTSQAEMQREGCDN